jgi:hypothetical protein
MADIGDRNTPGRRQQVNDFDMDTNNGMVTAFWPRHTVLLGQQMRLLPVLMRF